MRNFIKIGLLSLMALLAACNPYPSESEQMKAAMEQARAVYGDGNLLVETDTALFIPGLAEASGYYAGKKAYGTAALAALYNGYSEMNFNKEAAMASFKEAERCGELAHDSLSMARAEYWIGKLLCEEGRTSDALLSFKASRQFANSNDAELALIENGMASVYILSNQHDNAEVYLQNSLLRAQNSNLDHIEWRILNNYAVLYRLQGKYDQALDCLKSACEKTHLDDGERIVAELNLGNTFMALGDVDSADCCFQRLYALSQVANVKGETMVSVYDALYNFAIAQGNDSLALLYREKHEDALFGVMNQRQEQSVYRIQKQYDNEALRNIMNKKIIQRQKIILLFSVLLLALIIVILALRYRHKQLVKSEKELKQQLNSIKKDLRQSVQPLILDKLVVSQLKTIIVAHRTLNRAKDPQNEWRPLVSDIMFGKDSLFEAAQTVIETAYPKLYSEFLRKYPDLNETEAKVCMLSSFDLSNSEIAELLELKTTTVNQSRSTLRKKLDLKSDNKMDAQLRDIFSE